MPNVRLTATEMKAVAELVRHGYYRSVSEVLREGLGLLLAQHRVKGDVALQIRLERVVQTPRKRKRNLPLPGETESQEPE